MMRLHRVSKSYTAPRVHQGIEDPVVHALRDVTLEIAQGEFIAVMGPSGCGKSTLLHLLGGLDTPTSGEIWVHDQPIHRMDETALSLFRRKHVGVVFQFFNLLPQLTVLENIIFPLRLLGVSYSESESRASTLLESVGLQDKSQRLPAEISGGEQQRVAIARALVHRPRIVLADEPTGNLDSTTSAFVLKILKELHDAYHATLLLVTHAAEVSRAATRIVTMSDGRLVLNPDGHLSGS